MLSQLSIAVLSTMFAGVSYALAGGEKKKVDVVSNIKAQSSSDDEFKFIQVHCAGTGSTAKAYYCTGLLSERGKGREEGAVDGNA